MKNIIFAVGGTGGHIYPALALAEQLKVLMPGCEIYFIGGKLCENKFLNNSEKSFSIQCEHFIKKNPIHILSALKKNYLGFKESCTLIETLKPSFVLGFGSYHTLPCMFATKFKKIPLFLYAADSMPGKVIRLFSPFAKMTTIQFSQAAQFLRGNVVHVKAPLRKAFRNSQEAKKAAFNYFGLDEKLKTILIFGGSQGAQVINQAFLASKVIRTIAEKVQIIHLTGNSEYSEKLKKGYYEHGLKACVKDFETEMDLAWQAASLAVCRSGATTLAELLEFEVPALLIPYPYAAENHQERNAIILAEQVKGAKMLHQEHLNKELFLQHLTHLLEHQGSMLDSMKENIKLYKQKHQAIDLCRLIHKIGEELP